MCTTVIARSLRCIPVERCITPRRVTTRHLATTPRHPDITGLDMGEVAPATVAVPVMAAATGTVGEAGTTEGVAITGAATAIVHPHKARGPEAAMVPAPVVAGMATPAVVVVVAVVHAQAPADLAAITAKTAVSVVVATADRVVVIAE